MVCMHEDVIVKTYILNNEYICTCININIYENVSIFKVYGLGQDTRSLYVFLLSGQEA